MEYTLDRFAHEIERAIGATGLVPADQIALEEPKANVQADLALPCFRAAKQLGIPPVELARIFAGALTFPPGSMVGSVEAIGPFLNFTLNPPELARAVLAEVEQLGDRYGADDRGQNRTVIVEYSSPNIAKRMHVGHIRSTIIGQALNNILQFLGYHTVADNHLGDYGKQFGVMIAAVERFGRPRGEGEDALANMEELYSRYNRLIGGTTDDDSDPEYLDDAARAWSLKLEQGDPMAR